MSLRGHATPQPVALFFALDLDRLRRFPLPCLCPLKLDHATLHLPLLLDQCLAGQPCPINRRMVDKWIIPFKVFYQCCDTGLITRASSSTFFSMVGESLGVKTPEFKPSSIQPRQAFSPWCGWTNRFIRKCVRRLWIIWEYRGMNSMRGINPTRRPLKNRRGRDNNIPD